MEPHDAPPPPYSETDIYSASPEHQPPVAQAHASSREDDVSIAPSSSHSNVIYTPPDTPQDSHHGFNGGEDYQTTASAQVYFDTRPPASDLTSASPIMHMITVSEDPSPADFPYPNWAASRDVSQQDWRTFINYLIPDYADKANAFIIDRKLRASEDGGSLASASTRVETEAQLEQLRSSSQKRRFQDTVKEWNAGFFAVRSVTIRFVESESSSEPKARMPGEWESSTDAGFGRGSNAAGASGAEPSSQDAGGWRNLFGSMFRMNIGGDGVHVGPVSVEGDRVSIGRSFVVDGDGVRWNGRNLSEHLPSGYGRGWNADSRGHGRGRGSWWADPSDFSHRRDALHRRHDDLHHRHDGHGGPGGRHRSRSVHSNSSFSTSSSSDTESTVSSIGSLPDWDELKDSQIPVVKQSIQAWLAHPDQPITKGDFRRAKAEIKAAKSLPQPSSVDARQREEIKTLLSMFDDLKKNQRAILKAAKKARKAQRRAERRAKRRRHRGERREDRRHKREYRRAERERSRQHRRQGGAPDPYFNDPPMGPPHPPPPPSRGFTSPSLPVPPLGPPIPHAPIVPPIPLIPPVEACVPGAFFGAGRGSGPGFPFMGGWGRGGSHSHHPFGPWNCSPPAAAESSRAQQERAREREAQNRAAASEQAARARAQAQEQAAKARAQAQGQAAEARAQAAVQREYAKIQAAQAKAHAKQQADQAKAHAKAMADLAKTQAKEQKTLSKELADLAKAQAKEQKALSKEHAKKQKELAEELVAQQKAAAKHQAIKNLQNEKMTKQAALQSLQQDTEAQAIAAAKAGHGDKKRTEQSQTELAMEELENEIEELGRRIEETSLEVDDDLSRNAEREEAEHLERGKVRWLE